MIKVKNIFFLIYLVYFLKNIEKVVLIEYNVYYIFSYCVFFNGVRKYILFKVLNCNLII